MPELLPDDVPGQEKFVLSVDERVCVEMRRFEMALMGERDMLSVIGTRSGRMAAHEKAHVAFRVGAIAQALEEGRLIITEPTEEDLVSRETVDLDLHLGPDAEEPNYGNPT